MAVIAALAPTAVVVLAGTLASYLYAGGLGMAHRLAIGAVTGLAVASLAAFALAHAIAIEAAVTLGAGGALLAAIGLAAAPAVRRAVTADLASARESAVDRLRRPRAADAAFVAAALALVALVVLAFERAFLFDENGVATGYVNNVGDLPFHIHVATAFAYGANFPPMDPAFAGSGFAYPYMADLWSAALMAAGAPIRDAFFVLNVTLGLSLVGVVHGLTLALTRDRLAALMAPALVLLSGGLGWLVMLDQLRQAEGGVMAFLGALPQDYTIGGDTAYRWGNAISTLLVTQRSLLFGLPLALVVLLLLWRLIQSPPPATGRRAGSRTGSAGASVTTALRRRPEALAAGIFTGLLPLVHAHSFVVVMGTAFLLGLLFRQWREGRWLPWAIYVAAALALALPEVWWSTRASTAEAATFFGLEIGWDRGELDPVTFWLLNTGAFIPLGLAGLAWLAVRSPERRPLVLFSLPFLVWFVVPNVVKLAPWIWDNIKVLFYWYVGFVPLTVLIVAALLRGRGALRVAGLALLVSLTLAGSLDVWRVLSRQTEYQAFDADGVELAERIRQVTPPGSVVLHAPTWNTPVYLAGRQSVLGYPGHAWAHGYEYSAREADIAAIYAGAPEVEALLAEYSVDYVVVGPHERAHGPVDEAFWSRRMEVAAAGEYRLVEVAR